VRGRAQVPVERAKAFADAQAAHAERVDSSGARRRSPIGAFTRRPICSARRRVAESTGVQGPLRTCLSARP
jgi:hypothetical protein